jgi:hypothetical protein
MEPDGSLPGSQGPSNCPYPETDAPSPRIPTLFAKIHSDIILPFTSVSSEWYLTFKFSDHNFVYIFISPCVLYDSPISSLTAHVISLIISRRLNWGRHVARMEHISSSYKFVFGIPERKKLFGKPWLSRINVKKVLKWGMNVSSGMI